MVSQISFLCSIFFVLLPFGVFSANYRLDTSTTPGFLPSSPFVSSPYMGGANYSEDAVLFPVIWTSPQSPTLSYIKGRGVAANGNALLPDDVIIVHQSTCCGTSLSYLSSSAKYAMGYSKTGGGVAHYLLFDALSNPTGDTQLYTGTREEYGVIVAGIPHLNGALGIAYCSRGSSFNSLRFQEYDESQALLCGKTSYTMRRSRPSLTWLFDGMVAIYEDGGATTGLDAIVFPHHTSSGTICSFRAGTPFSVTSRTGPVYNPCSATFPQGEFVIGFDAPYGGSNRRVFAKVFRTHTSPRWESYAGVVSGTSPTIQSHCSIAVMGHDDFVMVWQDNSRGTSFDIVARRMKRIGGHPTSPFVVNEATQTESWITPAVTSLTSTSFYVVWAGEDSASAGIYGRLLDLNACYPSCSELADSCCGCTCSAGVCSGGTDCQFDSDTTCGRQCSVGACVGGTDCTSGSTNSNCNRRCQSDGTCNTGMNCLPGSNSTCGRQCSNNRCSGGTNCRPSDFATCGSSCESETCSGGIDCTTVISNDRCRVTCSANGYCDGGTSCGFDNDATCGAYCSQNNCYGGTDCTPLSTSTCGRTCTSGTCDGGVDCLTLASHSRCGVSCLLGLCSQGVDCGFNNVDTCGRSCSSNACTGGTDCAPDSLRKCGSTCENGVCGGAVDCIALSTVTRCEVKCIAGSCDQGVECGFWNEATCGRTCNGNLCTGGVQCTSGFFCNQLGECEAQGVTSGPTTDVIPTSRSRMSNLQTETVELTSTSERQVEPSQSASRVTQTHIPMTETETNLDTTTNGATEMSEGTMGSTHTNPVESSQTQNSSFMSSSDSMGNTSSVIDTSLDDSCTVFASFFFMFVLILFT